MRSEDFHGRPDRPFEGMRRPEGPRPPEGFGPCPNRGRGPHRRPEMRDPRFNPEFPDRKPEFRGKPFRPEFTEDTSLSALLRACGHRMHHGMPGGPHGSQEQILKILSLAGGNADQRDLQEAMRIRPASISELLKKLEEKGLVTRVRDEEDRRKVQISLTEAGTARASLSREEAREKDLFLALTEEEQETLRGLLLKLLKSWQPEGPRFPEI